jgi:hypothetical protein
MENLERENKRPRFAADVNERGGFDSLSSTSRRLSGEKIVQDVSFLYSAVNEDNQEFENPSWKFVSTLEGCDISKVHNTHRLAALIAIHNMSRSIHKHDDVDRLITLLGKFDFARERELSLGIIENAALSIIRRNYMVSRLRI